MDKTQKLTANIAAQVYISGNHLVEEAVEVAEKIVKLTGGLSVAERLGNMQQDIVFLNAKNERLALLNGLLSEENDRWRSVTGKTQPEKESTGREIVNYVDVFTRNYP